MCQSEFEGKVKVMFQFRGSEAGGILSYSGTSQPFCSTQTFNQLDGCLASHYCLDSLRQYGLLSQTVARQPPLFLGFSRQEYWSEQPFSSRGNLPDPGIEPGSPALLVDYLPSEPPGNEAHLTLRRAIWFSQSTNSNIQFSSVAQVCLTLCNPWTVARQASLSIANSQSLLKLMSIESVMSSNHVILSHPLLLLPSIFPSIRVFSNESVLCTRWPKYRSFSFIISPSNEYSGVISFRMDWCDLWLKRKMRKYKDTNE